jgi:hypothetical protein
MCVRVCVLHVQKKAVFFRNAVSSNHYVINSTLFRNRLICNASGAYFLVHLLVALRRALRRTLRITC